jgi:hypothetical protein
MTVSLPPPVLSFGRESKGSKPPAPCGGDAVGRVASEAVQGFHAAIV